MKSLDELPACVDDLELANSTSITVRGGDDDDDDDSSPLRQLLNEYKDKEPGVFSVGGTLGIDSNAFRLEFSDVYVSVVKLQDNAGNYDGKILALQGMVHFHIAKIFKASAALVGEYDTSMLDDALELFNKEMDDDEKEEAARTRNKFYTETGDTIRIYDLNDDCKDTNGLYFMFDTEGNETEKQYVFTATGLMDFSWLKKIGVNCGLKVGVIGAYNSFEDAWEVGLGVKLTAVSGVEWMVVGRAGFLNGQFNSFAFTVKGEISIGPVVLTQVKFGVSGLAENVQTYSPGLAVGFGPEINFKDLISPVAKVLGLKVGAFRVAEVGVFGDIDSDFQNISLSVEGTLLGLLEIKGGWKRINGNYNEISISVGTQNSSTFNFSISGSVTWCENQLSIRGSLSGSFKWDFTALGITWVGVNVGGGISVVYNQAYSQKTLSVSVSGRAEVKVAFVKVGVNVSKSWFFNLSTRGEELYCCSNALLAEATPSGESTRSVAYAPDKMDISGDMLRSYSWVATDLAAEGRMYITVAAQYALTDMEWILYGPDGSIYTSNDISETVMGKHISYSQRELTVDNPAIGEWTLDVYGSHFRNGEILIYAEAGDPVETGVRILSVDKTSVTLEYQAHATGENYLIGLYMERAGGPADEYDGTILDYLDATVGDEYRQVTIDLPEDVQGGRYQFYIMAQSTNCAEIAYSQKSEAVDILRRTAVLEVSDYRVTCQADELQSANVFFTVTNLGSVDTNDFKVDILLEDIRGTAGDVLVAASETISLAAGASQDLQLAVAIPEEFLGKLAVISVRLDSESVVDEGIFEDDDLDSKVFAPVALSTDPATVIGWTAVAGASTYSLEYAVEEDWDDGAILQGFTENQANLNFAPGNYSFRVTPFDSEGQIIEDGIQEWDDLVFHTVDFDLSFNSLEGSVSTEEFELMDGCYDWSWRDLGNFSGTLTLNQVDGLRPGVDEEMLAIEIINGEVVGEDHEFLVDNGLYYFTARENEPSGMAEELSFSVFGEIFPDDAPVRGVISLPDSLDADGVYSETLESWIGPFGEEDIWEYLLEDAGELSLSVINPEELTGTLVVELFVQSGSSDLYQRLETFTVNADTVSPTLLNDYIVTNNFYVRVGVPDNGKGEHSSDYILDLFFKPFDASPLDESEMYLYAGEEPIQIDGWVGYRNTADTYLLTVDSGCAGRYEFTLNGDAQEATLNLRSISGKLLKSVTVGQEGTAVISDVELYSGDYLVEIDSRNDVWLNNNTSYSLTVSQNEAFKVISESSAAIVPFAEQGEKLFFALDVPETALYDVSELQNAGLTAWFQQADHNGKLGGAKQRPDWVKLEWDVPTYMTICNSNFEWGETKISLDAENHKFILSSIPAVG